VREDMKMCVPEKIAGKLEKAVKRLIREKVGKEVPIKVKEQVGESLEAR
jgi:hypothetical protein